MGSVYSQVLSAAGGSPPYTWALTSGAFPDGLTLDSSGRISGTPTAAATSTLTVTVTDSAGRAIARTMSLRAVGALQIITESPLAGGLIGTAYSAILQASGGTSPFLWSLTSPPRGLSINGNTGEISGRLQQSGIQRFSATVSDSRQQTFTREYELVVLELPAITLAAPDDSESAQQPTVSVSLPNPYPVPITGVLTLTFTANTSIPRVSGRAVDDPAVQFSTGSRRVTYTIAPGETQARFGETRDRELFLSTGTVAGAISVSGTVRVGTTELSLAEPLQKTITVATARPVVTSLIVAPAAGGLAVTISGYSNTRELSQASFAFAAISGSTLASSEVTLNLASVFSGWYSSTASIASGSQFTITIPFTITGDVNAIASVAVTLTNSKGKSAAVSSSTR